MQRPHLFQFCSHHGSADVKHKHNILWQGRKICRGEVVHEIPIKDLWKSNEVRNQRLLTHHYGIFGWAHLILLAMSVSILEDMSAPLYLSQSWSSVYPDWRNLLKISISLSMVDSGVSF